MPNINIVFPEPLLDGATAQIKDDEHVHFQNTLIRTAALCNGADVELATIHLRERAKPKEYNGVVTDEGGWLEHLIIINYVGGRRLVVGAIQRKVGAESEFHS